MEFHIFKYKVIKSKYLAHISINVISIGSYQSMMDEQSDRRIEY